MTPPSPSHSDPPAIPDYDLLKPIGRGSYGEVWLARSVTGVFRVIKIVRRNRFDNDRPFRRELQGISRFQAIASGRPRQLALLHVGRNEEAGYFYYVMEPADDAVAGSSIHPDTYVPLTLKELLHRRGRLPAADCVQIALDLARALAVLHDERLIHRDIKPSNVIFVQGVPKLADVGLVASSDATLTSVGTHGYVPPEGPGSPAADLYSLGKLVYEMFTGLDRLEFPTIPPHLIEGSDASLVRELNAIILRACQPQPQQRHASAHDLARDLELVQAGRSVAFYEGIRRRFRLIATAAILIATATATLAFVLTWRSQVLHRANENARRALYRSDIAVAQLAHASGDLGRARAALQRQIPESGESDLRGIEWNILNHEVRGDGTPLESVPNAVGIRRLVTEPTGRWLAGSLVDDTVALWELPAGRLVRILTNAPVLGGFTPDGLLVVDEAHRALRFEHPLTGPVRTIQTGQRLYQLLPDGSSIVVTPDDDFIFTRFSFGKQDPLATFNITSRWPDYGVTGLTHSPSGRIAIISLMRILGASRTRMLVAVDPLANEVLWQEELSTRILWNNISPTDSYVVCNVGGLTPNLISTINPKEFVQLEGHHSRVEWAEFSPDSSFLATASADQTIRIFDVPSGKAGNIYRGLGRPATSVCWNKNSTELVAGDDHGNLRRFEFPPLTKKTAISGFFGDVHGDIALSKDGTLLAVSTTTNSISIIEPSTLTIQQVITNCFQPIVLDNINNILIGFGSNWNIKKISLIDGTNEVVAKPFVEDFILETWSISKCQQWVATTSPGGIITLINLISFETNQLVDPEGMESYAITFSSDSSELWTASTGGKLWRWKVNKPNSAVFVTEDLEDPQTITLSSDNRWVAVSEYSDSSIRIWDRQKGNWQAVCRGHRRFVQNLSFDQSNKRLISAGADGRIISWRVPEFEEVASFDIERPTNPSGDEGIAVLRISNTESFVCALTEDGRLHIWQAASKLYSY